MGRASKESALKMRNYHPGAFHGDFPAGQLKYFTPSNANKPRKKSRSFSPTLLFHHRFKREFHSFVLFTVHGIRRISHFHEPNAKREAELKNRVNCAEDTKHYLPVVWFGFKKQWLTKSLVTFSLFFVLRTSSLKRTENVVGPLSHNTFKENIWWRFWEPILCDGSPFNPCKLAGSISTQKTTPLPFLNDPRTFSMFRCCFTI